MVKIAKFWSLEEGIVLLKKEGQKGPLTIKEILRVLPGKGRSLILVLLCIPFCQPLQIPGLSMPFGFLIAFLGLRTLLVKRIWLPKSILEKKISSSHFNKISNTVLKLDRKIKPWVHPRLLWMCHFKLLERLNGLIIIVMGLLLALPLPVPLSNMSAAWSICFISIGMLEDDGVFVLVGYIISLITLIFFLVMGVTLKNIYQASF